MKLQQELASITEQIDEAESDIVLLRSRLAGLRAQRDALMAHTDTGPASNGHGGSNVPRISRTAEIEQIVCNAKEPVNTQEVLDALREAGGNGDKDYVVRSTLWHLLQMGRITRPSRGKYWGVQ